MSASGNKQQLAIGVFVVMAVVAAFVLIAIFGESSALRSSYLLYCHIESTGGPVKKGAPVRMMGIPVGKVKSVRLDLALARPVVVLEMQIYDEYLVKSDSFLRVEQASFIGDRVVQIYPGTTGKVLAEGDQITGKIAVNIEDVVQDVRETVTLLKESAVDIKLSFNNVNQIIGNKKFVSDVHGSASEIHAAAVGFNRVIKNSDKAISQLNEVLKSFERSGQGIEKFVDSIQDSEQILKQILKDVSKGKGSLGRLIEEDDFVDELQSTLKDIRRLVTDLKNDPSQVFWGKERKNVKRALSVVEIVQMVKSGLKTKTIVAQIESCGQKYHLDVNTLVDLKKQGFEDQVIEAMILNGR